MDSFFLADYIARQKRAINTHCSQHVRTWWEPCLSLSLSQPLLLPVAQSSRDARGGGGGWRSLNPTNSPSPPSLSLSLFFLCCCFFLLPLLERERESGGGEGVRGWRRRRPRRRRRRRRTRGKVPFVVGRERERWGGGEGGGELATFGDRSRNWSLLSHANVKNQHNHLLSTSFYSVRMKKKRVYKIRKAHLRKVNFTFRR